MLGDDGARERTNCSHSKFTLGGEGSVAAGPVGRTATAQTDAQMHAEILSWSRIAGPVRRSCSGRSHPARGSGRQRHALRQETGEPRHRDQRQVRAEVGRSPNGSPEQVLGAMSAQFKRTSKDKMKIISTFLTVCGARCGAVGASSEPGAAVRLARPTRRLACRSIGSPW